MQWPFGDSKAAVAVTSDGVVNRNVPILYVSHETDEDGEIIWQFHHDPQGGTGWLVLEPTGEPWH